MRAAFYESIGPARDVLRVQEVATPEPGPGEVRVRLSTSGVNPSDVKSRGLRKLAFPRVIPHSDGAGVIDAVGEGVAKSRVGERVWIWNGQFQRPSGTTLDRYQAPAGSTASGVVPDPGLEVVVEGEAYDEWFADFIFLDSPIAPAHAPAEDRQLDRALAVLDARLGSGERSGTH